MSAIPPNSARAYFDELYRAGGLDRTADGYVCFSDDEDLMTFFIFGESRFLRDFLIEGGKYKDLKLADRALFERGFLLVRQYDRGVTVGDEGIYRKDGDSWVTSTYAIQKGVLARVRLDISWPTLRYKKVVELKNDGTYRAAYTGYGHCEGVPAGVEQTGGDPAH